MPQGGEEGGRGGRGLGLVVLPGHYTVAVNSLKQDVTVEADPHSTLSESDRKARHSAILSAYSLQQQLIPARDAARALTDEMAGLLRFFRASDTKDSVEAVDKVTPQITKVQAQVDRAITTAAQVENAMENYSGLPTAAQLRQIDWAWEDGVAAATAVNKLITETLPAAYSSMGGAVTQPKRGPVKIPAK
jgi:hypothetical protein